MRNWKSGRVNVWRRQLPVKAVLIGVMIAGASFAGPVAVKPAFSAPKCGGVNQRPCKLWERKRACNKGLKHHVFKKKCLRRKPKKVVNCGRLNQRPCKVFERIPSCDKGLGQNFKLKKCVKLKKGQSALFYGIASAAGEVAKLEKICHGVASRLPPLRTGIKAFDKAAGCQMQYQIGFRCAAPMVFRKVGKTSNLAGRIDSALNSPRCRNAPKGLRVFCSIGAVIDESAVRPARCLAKVMANGGFRDVAAGSSQAMGSLCRAAGRLSFEMALDRMLRRKNNLKGYKRTLFRAAKKARKYSKKGAKIEKFFEKVNREPACRGVLN